MDKKVSTKLEIGNEKVRENARKMEEASQVFRRVRDKSYLTQADFAKKFAKSSNYVSMVERGTKNPGRKLVKAVLDFEAELDRSSNSNVVHKDPPQPHQTGSASAEQRIAEQSAMITWLMRQVEDAKAENSRIMDMLHEAQRTVAKLASDNSGSDDQGKRRAG